MENANCKNGVKRIPIGFRFRPTDEELVIHYLRRKVFSLPFPALNLIPELDVFNFNPWDLPGDLKEKRYFFSNNVRDGVNKCGEKLSSGCGYWKATGKDKQVVAPGTNIVIATRKSFVFYKGKSTKTQWFMRQFRLVGSIRTPDNITQMELGDWVVCCLYQSKRKPKYGVQPANFKKSVITDKIGLGLPSAQDSPSTPCSSGITDVISYSDMGQEEANSVNFS